MALVISAFRPATFFTNYNLDGFRDYDQSSFTFQLFPVPNDGCFTATISSSTTSVYDVKVFDQCGVEVYTKKDVKVSGSASVKIDLTQAPSRVYTLLCEGKEEFLVKKIIIDR